MRVRCFELKDVVLDLEDGLALIHLIELLTNESVGSKFNRVPRHRAQKLENVMIALKFIDSKKIKLVGIGPEVIAEGKKAKKREKKLKSLRILLSKSRLSFLD